MSYRYMILLLVTRQAYAADMPVAVIAAQAKVTPSTVYRRLRKAGINLKRS